MRTYLVSELKMIGFTWLVIAINSVAPNVKKKHWTVLLNPAMKYRIHMKHVGYKTCATMSHNVLQT